LPGVLVIHETEPQSLYRRRRTAFGSGQFRGFAPDGLTSLVAFRRQRKGGQLFAQVDKPKMTEDFVAAARWLKGRLTAPVRSALSDSVSAAALSTHSPSAWRDLSAGVPFMADSLSRRCRKSRRATAALSGSIRREWWLAGLRRSAQGEHVTYSAYTYDGANHGFHNDTTPRYDDVAAKLACNGPSILHKYLKA